MKRFFLPFITAGLFLAGTMIQPAFAAAPATGLNPAGYEKQLASLTRTPWTWETVMGKNTIKFEKDGTCAHTRFNGTFTFKDENTVVVKMPTRDQVLTFNFGKGEFTAYDETLKEKVTGRRALHGK